MRKRVLLVKTSSLGDVVHALPAISDIQANGAADAVDWIVEEPYASIPSLHSGVTNVLRVAIRRWRRTPWQRATRDDIAQRVRDLRCCRYDAVIDSQGLYKSAVIALAAHGPRYGLGWRSARERVAPFYHHTFAVPWSLHAVERNRLLVARALGYAVPKRCNYGITSAPRRHEWLNATRYAVLLHATSCDRKLWPEARWIELASALNEYDMSCVLPWGSALERERAARIERAVCCAVVAPAMDVAQFPALFAGAHAVVGVDTGLTHLAAALGTPTVGLYVSTDPRATGLYRCARARNLGGADAIPDTADVMRALLEVWSGPTHAEA